MRKQEMKYFILACIGIPTSIFLFIALATFMTMTDDLDKRIIRQEKYIRELEQEIKTTEMICIK